MKRTASPVKLRAPLRARYKLATDAIITFHTGASEDFLLKEFKNGELRNRLLKSAADFYGKLGALLGKDTDVASRRALAQPKIRAGRLDGQGRPQRGRPGGGRPWRAREGAGGRAGAGVVAKVDVGRSLIAVAGALLKRPARRTRRWRPAAGRSRCWPVARRES